MPTIKYILLFTFFIFHVTTVTAQVNIVNAPQSFTRDINVGVGSPKANEPSAHLEVGPTSGGTKGILLPRVSSRSAVAAPTAGLMIYETTTGKTIYYNGTDWIETNFSLSSPSDTLLYSTRAWRQKGIDSIAALLPAYALAAHVHPWADITGKPTAAAGWLTDVVLYEDTAQMLAPYHRGLGSPLQLLRTRADSSGIEWFTPNYLTPPDTAGLRLVFHYPIYRITGTPHVYIDGALAYYNANRWMGKDLDPSMASPMSGDIAMFDGEKWIPQPIGGAISRAVNQYMQSSATMAKYTGNNEAMMQAMRRMFDLVMEQKKEIENLKAEIEKLK